MLLFLLLLAAPMGRHIEPRLEVGLVQLNVFDIYYVLLITHYSFACYLLQNKLLGVGFVQNASVQNIARAGLDEVDLEVVGIVERDLGVAEVVGIREAVGGDVGAHLAETLNVSGTARDDVHGSLGVVHAGRIGHVVVGGCEALRVVHVAEDGEVHSVFVEEGLERRLARRAGVTTARGVPGTVTGNDEPRGHRAVDGSQISVQELDLLVRGSEGSTVEAGRAAGTVGRVREVSFGIEHDDMGHAVLERVPERRVRQLLRRGRVGLGRRVGRGGTESGGHGLAETVHEVGEVLLA